MLVILLPQINKSNSYQHSSYHILKIVDKSNQIPRIFFSLQIASWGGCDRILRYQYHLIRIFTQVVQLHIEQVLYYDQHLFSKVIIFRSLFYANKRKMQNFLKQAIASNL